MHLETRFLVAGIAAVALCLTTALSRSAPAGHFGGGHIGGGGFGGGHFGGGHVGGGGFGGGHFGASHFGGTHFGATHFGATHFGGGHFGAAHFGGTHFGATHFGGGHFGAAHFGGTHFGATHFGATHFGAGRIGAPLGGRRLTVGRAAATGLGGRRFNRNVFGDRMAWNRWGGRGGFRGRGWGGGWGGWGWGGWAGPVFWPFVLGDVFSSALWPYAYSDDPFWSYGGTFADETADYGPGYGYAADYAPTAGGNTRPHTDIAQGCGGFAPGVTDFPISRIKRAVKPTPAQAAVLNDFAAAISKANAVVNASCPSAPPITLIGRLDAAQSRFDAVIRAIDIVRAPLAKFYDSLSEEQRQRLDALGAAENQSTGAPAPSSPAGDDTFVSVCRQQAASFARPVSHLERIVQPTPEQQVAVDALKQAAAKAADQLLSSCPAQLPATPVERLDAMKKRLAAMVQAIQITRPQLVTLYDSLSEEQKARLDSGAAPPREADRAKVGELTCRLAPTIGFILGGRQRVSCSYIPDGPSPSETYYGHLSTAGIDIGVSGGGQMMWAVFAPVGGRFAGALAGTYVGASADVAVGVGLGANVLIGGAHRSIALQPISVEGNTGVDVAVGASELRLHWMRPSAFASH
jgi:hypothetical protein